MFAISKTKQLNIFEEISELKSFALRQPVGFINLLAENFDIESFIPDSFTDHYYSTYGRNRSYKLSSFKFNPCIQSPNTVNVATMRSDFYLTGISKLVNVVLAYALNNSSYIRTTRKLLKLAI